MAGTIEKEVIAHKVCEYMELPTDKTIDCTLLRSTCYILEMEDVLFHLNSAVLMPENPEGISSHDGGGASDEQLKVSGVRALSLVFRQFQDSPDKRILVCGHADRSGDAPYNFELSGMRAQNVLYLIQGKRGDWAEICANKQRVEDYQQIMQYYSLMNSWDCDPGKVDNAWGDKTKKAMDNFIDSYNNNYTHKPAGNSLDPALVEKVDKDSKHEWPKEMWEAVYDLYEHDLISTTCSGKDAKKNFDQLRVKLQFVDPNKPYVACGESFPKDKRPGISYRSQEDRRVEILFFDKNEVPTITCPDRTSSVHTDDECPFWSDKNFKFEYIPAKEFFTASYHLKFEYFDKIKKEFLPARLNDGLIINTLKEGNISLTSKTFYENGVYKVVVEGITNSPREDDIHFTFETTEQLYLYTENDSSDPVIISNSELENSLSEERNTLPTDQQANAPVNFSQLPLTRKHHYYDLPVKWDSRNWQCKQGTNEDIFKKNIVNTTSSSEPIIFCFDDIVLVEEQSANNFQPVEWKNEYRFTIFSIKMAINNADSDRPYFTQGQTERNYLPGSITGPDLRIVALKGVFYDVDYKRIYNGDIIGIRAAIKNYSEIHISEKQREPLVSAAGHYDLHFFTNCLDESNDECSIVLPYWSCELKIGNGSVAENPDLNNFRKIGMSACKERWEKKEYSIVPRTDPNNKNMKVFVKYFFEDNPLIPSPHCTVNIHDPTDPNYRSSMGLDEADFAKDTYQENTSIWSQSEDGYDYYWYTMAHELGHACGLDDEYLESISEDNDWSPVLPKFEQYYEGMPYSSDEYTMMQVNRALRIRHFWYFCYWLNNNAEVQAKTGNTIFQINHNGLQNGANQNFEYYLPNDVWNYYDSAHDDTDIPNGTNGLFDLFLYQLGQDETTNKEYVELVTNQTDFDGILVLRINILWNFKNHTGSSSSQWASNDDKLDFLRDFQFDINNLLNKRFWIACATATKLKKMYLYFVPHYNLENLSDDSSDKHFTITVRQDDPSSGDAFNSNISGNSFEIGTDEDSIVIMRHMLGLSTHTTTNTPSGPVSTPITDITANELGFISTWVKNETNATDNYAVHE